RFSGLLCIPDENAAPQIWGRLIMDCVVVRLVMHSDVYFAPVVGRRFAGWVVDNAGDVGLQGIGGGALEHGEPGDIVDQFLLGILVERDAVRAEVAVGGGHFLLHRLLLTRAGTEVLAIIPDVVGRAFAELERGPVLRIRIVRTPGEGPHL